MMVVSANSNETVAPYGKDNQIGDA
jgi:hypothetical protein